MKLFSSRSIGIALTLSTLLAACGGSSHGVLPSSPHSTNKQGSGFVKVSVHVPARAAQSARQVAYAKSQIAKHALNRKPDYFSGSTSELDFTLESNNGNAASSGAQAAFDFTLYLQDSSECTTDGSGGYNCSVTEPAPVGNDTYKVTAYQCSVSGSSSASSCQSLGGTLTMLSAAFTSVNVQYNQATVMAFTMSAVVASIDWAPVTYAKQAGTGDLPSTLWLTQPNGANIPKYTPATTSYSCTSNAGSGTGNGCYEPVAKGYAIAYGEVLEARDSTGAIILGASNNGTIYQTPVYLDTNGNAVTITWSCSDNAGGTSLTFETGGGPYTANAQATKANQSFNSPVTNPAADPDGGNTTDANGNPVTALGNNGAEINFDGADQPVLDSPDSCTAKTSSGLSTALNFYAGLGEGGLAPLPAPTLGPGMYIVSSAFGSPTNGVTPPPNANSLVYYASQGSLRTSDTNPYVNPPTSYMSIGTTSSASAAVNRYGGGGTAGTVMWVALPKNGPSLEKFVVGQSGPVATIALPADSNPESIALDSSGNVYELDGSCGCINVYASSATGTATPIRTINPSNAISNKPTPAIFIDRNDNLWLTDRTSYTYELPSSVNGTGSAIQTISEPCLGVEPDGSLVCGQYAGTTGSYSALIIMSPSNAYTTPVFTYSLGSNWREYPTSFNQPNLTTDSNGFIYIPGGVAGSSIDPPTITVFEPYSAGISQPYATISGGNDGVDYPDAIEVLGNAAAPAAGFTEYPLPTSSASPYDITIGADGALWFTESAGNKIGRITAAGQITEYAIPTAGSDPQGITLGPDGNIWFTENAANQVAQITPSGSITEYLLPNPFSGPNEIVTAPSGGSMWFTETAGRLGQLSTSGGVQEVAVQTTGQQPNGLAIGPNQTLWFTGANACEISVLNLMNLAISNFPYTCAGSGSGMTGGISAGPDGDVWLTGSTGLPNQIARIDASGAITQFALSSETDPVAITSGPDGALWFTESMGNSLGRITTAGTFSHVTIPTASAGPHGIVTGPDGAIWFTEGIANKIGRYHP